MSKFWLWINAHRTQLIGIAFWLALIVGTQQYMQANNLTFADLTRQLQATLTEEWYGPIIYIIVYLVRPLILFPASLLTILAGNVYGLWLGFLYALLAGTASSAFPYIIGRWFASENKTGQADAQDSALSRFVDTLRRNPFQAVLTARLLYLPYDLVSIVAGNLRISFVTFFAATAIGNIFGAFSYVGIGASIEGDIASGEISLNPAVLVLSIGVLIGSLAVSRFLKARQARSDAAESAIVEEIA
jgi:uncharacterized membrane protein YdjX (TVP38/TMEM64 family)